MHDATAFWLNGRGLRNITPKGKPWPEGKRFRTLLASLGKQGRIVDFGCGVGRLAHCFDPDAYHGVDVSAAAVDQARRLLPAHTFETIGPEDPLPPGDVTLAHTVLVHMPDETIEAFRDRVRSPVLVVSEVLGRRYRHPDRVPPTFNRDEGEYLVAMAPTFRPIGATEIRYSHYDEKGGLSITALAFERV